MKVQPFNNRRNLFLLLIAAMAMNLSWQFGQPTTYAFSSASTVGTKLTAPKSDRKTPSKLEFQRIQSVEPAPIAPSDESDRCREDLDTSCQANFDEDGKTISYIYDIAKSKSRIVKKESRHKHPDDLVESDFETVNTMEIVVHPSDTEAGVCPSGSCEPFREEFVSDQEVFSAWHVLAKEQAKKYHKNRLAKIEAQKKQELEDKKNAEVEKKKQKKKDWCELNEDGHVMDEIEKLECKAGKLEIMETDDPRFDTFLTDLNSKLPDLYFSPEEGIRERALEMGLSIRITSGVSASTRTQYDYLDKVSVQLLAMVPNYAALPGGDPKVWTMYNEMENIKLRGCYEYIRTLGTQGQSLGQQMCTNFDKTPIGQLITNKIEEAQKKPLSFLGRVAPGELENTEGEVTDPRNGSGDFDSQYSDRPGASRGPSPSSSRTAPARGNVHYSPGGVPTGDMTQNDQFGRGYDTQNVGHQGFNNQYLNRGQNLAAKGQSRSLPGRGIGGSLTYYSPSVPQANLLQNSNFGNGYNTQTQMPNYGINNNPFGGGYDYRTPGINPNANNNQSYSNWGNNNWGTNNTLPNSTWGNTGNYSGYSPGYNNYGNQTAGNNWGQSTWGTNNGTPGYYNGYNGSYSTPGTTTNRPSQFYQPYPTQKTTPAAAPAGTVRSLRG